MALLQPRDYVITDTAPSLPSTQSVPDMSSVRVSWTNQASAPTITLADPLDKFVGHYNGVGFEGAAGASISLIDKYQVAEFVSDQAGRRWLMQAVSPAIEPRHLFTFTGGQDASTGNALTMTFQPLSTGQVNEFFTLSADSGGTRLTATMDLLCDYNLVCEFSAKISSNNSDVSWRVNPFNNTAAADITPAMDMSFAHARSNTDPGFPMSLSMPGVLGMAAGEFIRFDFTRTEFSNSSDCTLDSGGVWFSNFVIL